MEQTRPHVDEIDDSDETATPSTAKPSVLAQLGQAMPVVNRMFGTDLRSLAALRIVLAVIVLLELALRAPDLRALYTDEGVMTRGMILESLSPWHWSLGFMSGAMWMQQAIFLAAVIAATCMLVGYKTRLMTFIVWALVVSIQLRNPMLISGGDTLLRLLLLWAVFAPMGAVWSVDRRLNPEPKRLSLSFLSFGSLGLFLQIAFMYWFTAILKWQNAGADWQEDRTALFHTLGRELYRTPFGGWAQQFTEVLEFLTIATLVIEFIAPILLFSPFWTARLRMVGITALVGLQAGIFLTMDIGIFPRISALCMVMFLPASFWEAVEVRVRAVAQIRTGRFGEVRGALEQSFQGVIQVIRPARADLSFSVSPRITGNQPANRAVRAGASATPVVEPETGERTPERPVRARSPLILNALAAFLLIFIFAWNMTSVTAFTMPAPSKSNPIAYGLGIYQNWHMFAPPSTQTTWYVMVGKLENDQQVEMLYPIIHDDMSQIIPVTSWEQFEDMDIDYYKNIHWRMYLARIGTLGTPAQQASFAGYVCRTWNDVHDGPMKVAAVQYLYVSLPILPEGEDLGEQTRQIETRFECG